MAPHIKKSRSAVFVLPGKGVPSAVHSRCIGVTIFARTISFFITPYEAAQK